MSELIENVDQFLALEGVGALVVEGLDEIELASFDLTDDAGGFGLKSIGKGAEIGDLLGNFVFGERGFAGEAGDFDDVDGGCGVGEGVGGDFVIDPGFPFFPAPLAGKIFGGDEGEEDVGAVDAVEDFNAPVVEGLDAVFIEKDLERAVGEFRVLVDEGVDEMGDPIG